jgi:hypothetical protein
MNNRGQQKLMLIWPFGIVFMQFCLFRIDQFEFSIGTSICLIVVVFNSAYIRINSLKQSYISIIALCFFFSYTILLCSSAHDIIEYFKSFIQVFILAYMLFQCCYTKLPNPLLIQRSVHLFLLLLVAVALLVIAQFVMLNVYDSYTIMKIFGPFSPLGPGYLVYEPHPLSFIKRPNGIFSEPSVAGWFLVFGTSIAITSPIFQRKSGYIAAMVSGLAAIATLSMSAIINIAVLSLVYLWIKSKTIKRLYINFLLVITVIVTLGWVAVTANITSRFENFFIEGTSSYYRLNAPLQLLSESLREFPFGHPLGQVQYILSKSYMINWKLGSTVNIDNSFFMISYYYGILGIVIIISVCCMFIVLFLKRSHASLLLITILLALAETGSLWSPNMVLIIGYGIILIRYILAYEANREEISQSQFLMQSKNLILRDDSI